MTFDPTLPGFIARLQAKKKKAIVHGTQVQRSDGKG
jgi:hypothetical protein